MNGESGGQHPCAARPSAGAGDTNTLRNASERERRLVFEQLAMRISPDATTVTGTRRMRTIQSSR